MTCIDVTRFSGAIVLIVNCCTVLNNSILLPPISMLLGHLVRESVVSPTCLRELACVYLKSKFFPLYSQIGSFGMHCDVVTIYFYCSLLWCKFHLVC